MATQAPTLTPGRPISRRAFRRLLIAILAVAFVVRLAAALHYSLPPLTDAHDYDRTAVSIVDGRGYPPATLFSGGPSPSAFRPPAYPYFLAGIYELTGTSDAGRRWEAGRIAQAVLGVAVVGLVALIGLQLCGQIVALIAGAIAAVYPNLIFSGTSLLTEPLFTVLLLSGIAALLRYRGRDPRLRWLLLAGACAGLATLTRTNGAVAILVFAIGAWTLRPTFALRSLRAPAIVVATAALTILPWTIRNAVELHAFVPVSTQTGFGLAGQYNGIAAGDRATWVPAYLVPRYCPLFVRTPRCTSGTQHRLKPRALGEYALGQRLTHLSIQFALDHPTHVLSAGFWNGLRFFDIENPIATESAEAHFVGQPTSLARPEVYGFWLLAPFAIAGCFTALARRIPLFVWLIPPLIFLSVTFVVATSRYRAPIDPILIILGACALATAPAALRRIRG